jgi:hypothetical protein
MKWFGTSEASFKEINILQGHTFALDDYYTWNPPGQTNFIMKAGSAMFITEFDAWVGP